MSSWKKKLAVCTSALAIAGAADAAVYGESTPYLVGAGGVTVKDVGLPETGSFTDTFFFQLKSGVGAQTGITSLFWGEGSSDIPSLTFALAGPGISSVLNPKVSLSPSGQNLSAGTTFSGLQAGALYGLTITGADASNLGTSYTFQIAAVPEPEVYAMLLAGLAVLGSVARGRRRAD